MKDERSTAPKSVDGYFAKVPAENMRAALQKLRETIKAAAPEAEEVISYKMPAFRHHGMLVYYAAFNDHCSLFVASDMVRRKFAAELKPFVAGKGTLRFTPQQPLPADLVKRIVKVRIAENEGKRRTGARTPKRPRKGSPADV